MHTAAARGVDALVLFMYHPHTTVLPGILIADLTRAVRTAVVKEQQLKILKRLAENALYARSQIFLAPIHGDYNRYLWHNNYLLRFNVRLHLRKINLPGSFLDIT